MLFFKTDKTAMISPEDVIRRIEFYYQGGALKYNQQPANTIVPNAHFTLAAPARV